MRADTYCCRITARYTTSIVSDITEQVTCHVEKTNLRGVEDEQRWNEIFGISADAAEVLVRKTEVSSDDVWARLVNTLVQKRRNATEHDIDDDSNTPSKKRQVMPRMSSNLMPCRKMKRFSHHSHYN